MDWLFLVGAGLAEIGFTTCMKLSHGFRRLVPSLLFFVFAPLSFWLLATALQSIPLGTGYAVWTGIGAFGTAVVGMVWFKEQAKYARIALLGVLILTIVGLKLVS